MKTLIIAIAIGSITVLSLAFLPTTNAMNALMGSSAITWTLALIGMAAE